MKKYINLMLVFAGFALMIGCGSKDRNYSPPASGGICAAIQAGVPLTGRSCTTVSGKWTAYDVSESSSGKGYSMYCGGGDNEHYSSQADFDANEGTSTSPSVTITSNEDYLNTPTCASGSINYNDGSGATKHTFIWTKQP